MTYQDLPAPAFVSGALVTLPAASWRSQGNSEKTALSPFHGLRQGLGCQTCVVDDQGVGVLRTGNRGIRGEKAQLDPQGPARRSNSASGCRVSSRSRK